MTTIQRTMAVPADRRLRLDIALPETIRCDTVTVVVYDAQDAVPDNGYAATLAACQEARDIMSGKIPSKTYSSLEELNRELDAEYEAEYGAQC